MYSWIRKYIANTWCNTRISTRIIQPLTASSHEAKNSKINCIMSKQGVISITIISPEGKVISLNVKPDMTVSKIKTNVTKQFYSDDASKKQQKFRLIQLSKFKWLNDDNSVKDAVLKENDQLLLVSIRSVPVKESLSEETLRGPTEEVILQATNDISVQNAPTNISSVHCPPEYQNEIRKIFITLVRACAKIILYSSEASKIYDILKDKLEARCKPVINPNALKNLIEMGYPQKKVMKALHLRKSNMMDALQWLIEHQSDSEDDDDDDDDDDDELDLLNVAKECQSLGEDKNIISIVDLLLESLHRYKRMDFKPDSKAFQVLLDMGFEKKDVIDALKITGNSQTSACEWLLGERRHSLQDLNEELDIENPIYKAIMYDPRIQLSLTNPNMLLVYLSILEVPVSLYERIRDPEVGPILDHIMATYNAEKYAIHFNQFVPT